MHYLHSKRPMIIHRDLKSPNILVFCTAFFYTDLQLDGHLTPKISDFGLSKTREHSNVSNTHVNTLGTCAWAAPEYLTVERIDERNEKGDVFSFGVIAWELLTCQTPWKSKKYTNDDIKQSVIKGERLTIPSDCAESLREVMKKCWKHGKKKKINDLIL